MEIKIEELQEKLEALKELVKKFKPLAELELKSLNVVEFKEQVCFNRITPEATKSAQEGDILYECASCSRRYFDRLNRKRYYEDRGEYEKAKDMERLLSDSDKPMINVNVINNSKFSIPCSRYQDDDCPLQNYVAPDWRKAIEEQEAKSENHK